MKTKKIVVLPYDERWPEDFEAIKATMEAPLAGKILSIEHVGSTSVPGLAAKPIIDIDIVIADASDFPAVRQALEALGYFHEGNLGLPGREAFGYEGKPDLREHHLYVCRQDALNYKKHIYLRDYLRGHPDMRDAYAEVKRQGAALYPDDIDGYLEHKTAIIHEIYEKAGLKGYL